MLGAWSMVMDYVTSPITKRGQIVYGMLLGILTGLFRLFVVLQKVYLMRSLSAICLYR